MELAGVSGRLLRLFLPLRLGRRNMDWGRDLTLGVVEPSSLPLLPLVLAEGGPSVSIKH